MQLLACRARRGFGLDNLAQKRRKRCRCHRSTVSGWTKTRAERQSRHRYDMPAQNQRSKRVRRGRVRFLEIRGELAAQRQISDGESLMAAG